MYASEAPTQQCYRRRLLVTGWQCTRELRASTWELPVKGHLEWLTELMWNRECRERCKKWSCLHVAEDRLSLFLIDEESRAQKPSLLLRPALLIGSK